MEWDQVIGSYCKTSQVHVNPNLSKYFGGKTEKGKRKVDPWKVGENSWKDEKFLSGIFSLFNGIYT
jgi:hypothetical protein